MFHPVSRVSHPVRGLPIRASTEGSRPTAAISTPSTDSKAMAQNFPKEQFQPPQLKRNAK